MSDDSRIEIVARALARHRLGQHALASGLHSDTARSILDQAVEKLWPSLLDEAKAVVEALDAARPPGGVSPEQRSSPPQEAAVSEAADAQRSAGEPHEFAPPGGEQPQAPPQMVQQEREQQALTRPHRPVDDEADDPFINPLGRPSL